MKTIALFFGGNSLEHEISLITAHRVLKAIDSCQYQIYLVYLNKVNECYFTDKIDNFEVFLDPEKLEAVCKKVTIQRDAHGGTLKAKFKSYHFDIAFPLVHGRGIEDGTLIALFNFYNIPYVGGTIIESAMGMDKSLSKVIASQSGIKTIKSKIFDLNFDDGETIIKEAELLGYPLMVKANTLGSSIGIKRANNKEELLDGVNEITKYDRYFMLELCLEDFCEYNIAIFQDKQELLVSAIEEVDNNNNYLSYDDKYDGEINKKVQKQLPANISSTLENTIIQKTKKLYRSFKAQGLVRLDYLFDKSSKTLYFSEINIIPGSLAYYLFEAQGMLFNTLIDRLISKARYDFLANKRYINSLSSYRINNLLEDGIKK